MLLYIDLFCKRFLKATSLQGGGGESLGEVASLGRSTEHSPMGSEKGPERWRRREESPLPMKGQEEGREQESEAAGCTHSLATRTDEIPAEESLPSGVTANPPGWDFHLRCSHSTHPPPITHWLSMGDCPQQALGNLSDHFSCHFRKWGATAAAEAKMLLNILGCTGQPPPTGNYQNVNDGKVEKPRSRGSSVLV